MNRKFLSCIFTIITISTIIMSTIAYASTNDVTLEEVENNVCQINLGSDGKLVKKLVSVDNVNKEATLQVDVMNQNNQTENIKPSEIFLVLDNSASMAENTLSDGTTRKTAVFNAAKTLTNNILTAQSGTKIGVVSFSSNLDVAKEGTLADANLILKPTSDSNTITSAIDSITMAGDRTDIDAGLQVAKSNFDADASLNKYLILLTDGVPNTAVGGPIETYSGDVATKTKATLQSVIDSGINIITVMTGVNSTYEPDPDGALSADAKGKTYQDLAQEIFGTQSAPSYGKFYYVTDDKVSDTITKDVYADTVTIKETSIKNITITDYFPDDIIANYDFSIVDKANIGNVTETVDTKNNSITWTIDKLDANQTASFKYKLKLKDNYNKGIINQIMPTNRKVDVTYTGTDGKIATQTSDVSPKIVLKGDDTIATTAIPKTGDRAEYIIITLIIGIIFIGIYYYKHNRINK